MLMMDFVIDQQQTWKTESFMEKFIAEMFTCYMISY